MGRPRKHKSPLPPCVYFKNGAYWYVKRNVWTRLPEEGPSTLQTALEAYANLVETPGDGKMPALIDDALAFTKKRKPPLAATTIKQYSDAAKILKRKLRQFNPEQVQQRHVAGIKRSMVGTPNMFNRCLSFLRQVFDYALEEELPGVDNNPGVGVKRLPEGKRTQMPTEAQHAALVAVTKTQAMPRIGKRQAVIFDLERLTGQRIIDILHLENADCADELPGIRFDPQKTGKPFYAKWTPELREVISRARMLHGKVRSIRWLFPGQGARAPLSYKACYDAFKRACRAAGIEGLVQHDWRAMALSRAKKQGKDPQALGRHSTPQNTERYLRERETPTVDTPTWADDHENIRHLIDDGSK
jgi:integrase